MQSLFYLSPFSVFSRAAYYYYVDIYYYLLLYICIYYYLYVFIIIRQFACLCLFAAAVDKQLPLPAAFEAFGVSRHLSCLLLSSRDS